MRIFVTGGTGLVGRRVIGLLVGRGDEVVCLTRDPATAGARLPAGVTLVDGDPAVAGPWQGQLQGCDAVINLAGESVGDGLWTRGKIKRIRRSRLAGTGNVVAALAAVDRKVTLINASAVGFYGDQQGRALKEGAAPGAGFLARLAVEWENAALRAEHENVRVVLLRIGMVLDAHGGALPRLTMPFRFGLGGRLGSGNQYVPWIHATDLARVIEFVLDQGAVAGPVNAVVPDPPTQAQFAEALGRVLNKPARFKVPAWALKMALRRKAEVVLYGQRAVPGVLRAAGFRFKYAELDAALADLLVV